MLKKLDENKISEILEAGIAEFALCGPDRASMSRIAHKSGVSVGVLYKYYDNKDAFFLACLRHALISLKSAIDSALSGELPVLERARLLISAVQKSAKEQPNYHILYHEITAGACRRYAGQLAFEIEGISASVYAAMLKSAQEKGEIRSDLDPRLMAFFFDNLLMMLQFSYSAEYYRKRFGIYCGADAMGDDARVLDALTKFLSAAFGADSTVKGGKA